ncbi:MAG: 3,4-dihydroxy-2-butanone-4-phosphate synthase, partial [Kiloniellaceae bacterium]
ARLAALNPAAVICEIMNDDGTMARRQDLITFAPHHGRKIATIADLIAYRRRHDRIVERVLTTNFESQFGGLFQMAVYINRTSSAEHIALWKGDLSAPGPVLVRVHVLDVLDDVLGHKTSGKVGEVQRVMHMIGETGRGVMVLIREPPATGLSDAVRARLGEPEKTFGELRDYGIGAQILLDLGVTDMIVLSNTKRTIVGLDGYGLRVVEQRPIGLD